MKCQVCKHAPAEWSWQPCGPDENPLSFSLPGNHYRGFPIVKVCDFCKREAIEVAHLPDQKPVRFTYKAIEYVFDGKQRPYAEYLWHGGISGSPGMPDYEMICRYIPDGSDIVAAIYAPGLAQELIDIYNQAHR